MRNQNVYDLPTRLFHWIFAGLFIFAFLIAKTVDDESATFSYHMLAGLLLAFVVTLRLIWGVIGTKYAKFSSFALQPSDLISYFSGIFSGNKSRHPGHNPASSWAAIVMFILALSLAGTGFLMATGAKETFEDFHEVLANLFLITVLAHVAGVIFHSFRHRDGIAFSMLDGKKETISNSEPIQGQKPIVALVFLILVVSFANYLSKNYNPTTRALNLFGTSLNLGENEGNDSDENKNSAEKSESGEGSEHESNDDD